MRVLVVDDDPGIRAVLEVTLSEHEVVMAADGKEALAALEGPERFDAAVVDIMMPGLDGVGLVTLLRHNPAHADLVVVMLTALGAEAEHVRAYAAGADAYVTKPFDPDALTRQLDALAAQSSSERSARRTEELQRAELLKHIEHAFT